MRIAILSDIHANSYALDRVLDQVERCEINQLIIAGDTVGYYYGIREVLQSLSRFKIDMVRGNHEEMLFGLESGLLNKKHHETVYGSALSLTLDELNENEISIFRNSSHPKSIEIDSLKILISHGSPWDINLYLYEDVIESYWKEFSKYDEQVFFIGHTHRPLFFERDGKIIINPGSVGQSRTKPGYADWAIFDTQNRNVEFKSTPYEYAKILEDCDKNNPGVSFLTKSFSKIQK
jgi:putative phosphoesterase